MKSVMYTHECDYCGQKLVVENETLGNWAMMYLNFKKFAEHSEVNTWTLYVCPECAPTNARGRSFAVEIFRKIFKRKPEGDHE